MRSSAGRTTCPPAVGHRTRARVPMNRSRRLSVRQERRSVVSEYEQTKEEWDLVATAPIAAAGADFGLVSFAREITAAIHYIKDAKPRFQQSELILSELKSTLGN